MGIIIAEFEQTQSVMRKIDEDRKILIECINRCLQENEQDDRPIPQLKEKLHQLPAVKDVFRLIGHLEVLSQYLETSYDRHRVENLVAELSRKSLDALMRIRAYPVLRYM